MQEKISKTLPLTTYFIIANMGIYFAAVCSAVLLNLLPLWARGYENHFDSFHCSVMPLMLYLSFNNILCVKADSEGTKIYTFLRFFLKLMSIAQMQDGVNDLNISNCFGSFSAQGIVYRVSRFFTLTHLWDGNSGGNCHMVSVTMAPLARMNIS